MQTKTNNQFGTHRIARVSSSYIYEKWLGTKRTPHTTTTEASLFRCVVFSSFFFFSVRCRLFHSFFECVVRFVYASMLPFIIYSFLVDAFGLLCVLAVWLTAMAMAMVSPSQFVHFNTFYRFFISLHCWRFFVFVFIVQCAGWFLVSW